MVSLTINSIDLLTDIQQLIWIMGFVRSNSAADETNQKGRTMTKSVKTNKTSTQAAALVFATATVQKLDALARRRQEWESTAFAKANEGLYAILAECQEIYEEKFLNAGDSDQKALRADLKARLEHAGVKVQNNTTTLTMVVRFVFGSDRKRAHGYNYVIRAALSHGVAPQQLPSWIKANGGIEEIKRKTVPSKKALANREIREAAIDQVKAAAETAAINPLGRVVFSEAILLGQHAVLVVQPSTDGTGNVVAILAEADQSVVEALYKRIARESLSTKQLEETRASEKAINTPVGSPQRETADQRMAA